jgi:tetratricopeptide (TPR) repeat protein
MEIGSLYYDSLINQGVCYQNLKVFDEAIKCNEEAIKISPNDESAYFNKAMCTLQKIYGIKNKNYEGVRKKYCH